MGKTWPDRLISFGAFLGFFGAYLLFARGPANNPTQHAFRIGVAVCGLVLGIIGFALKARDGGGGDKGTP